MKTIRLAHLSDIHFGGENVAAVAACAARLAAERVDLIVVTGDVTALGEPHEFAAAAAWIDSLPGEKLVTPGNHDSPYVAWGHRFFTPFLRFERAFGPAGAQTHRGDGFVVRGVNTARGVQPRMNWSKGQISTRQVDEAAAWLARAAHDDLRVVALHHPLMEMIGGPMTGKVWGGRDAARRFSQARVDLVLSGHIHAPFALPYAFVDERTYAVGAGTLSVRERGTPPSFNLIEADAGEMRVTSLAWTGSHYEAARTWSLDRRTPS